ncbi:YaiO family outer membrane beta-barrel protein [Phenylobacterium sp.]|uniref:YaiO family outer membrane beta-barrel protein n=1 Tax=Phenylobacterium sp. TaxID=1871053 RepID=UPI003784D058
MSALLVLVQAAAADPAMAAAVEARLAGRNAEAVAAFERLARERPADADVWLNLGLAYLAEKRWADADRALENTLRLAPGYGDARLAYARSAYFSGDRNRAKSRLAPLLAAQPVNAEARQLDADLAAAAAAAADPGRERAWRFDLAHAESRLTKGLGSWRLTSAALSRRSGDDVVALNVERTRRFGIEDIYAEGLFSRRFDGGADAYVAIGGAPDADYRPEFGARLGGSVAAGGRGDWRLRLGAEAQWQRYAVGDVRGVHPFAVLSGPRIELTARSINTFDERDDFRSGYALRLAYAATSRLTLFAGWADAPESAEGVTVDVRAVSAGASIAVNDATSVRLDVSREDRGAYEREELAVALTRRF